MDEDLRLAIVRMEEHLRHIVYRLDQEHIAHKEIEQRMTNLEHRVIRWGGIAAGIIAVWSVFGPFLLRTVGLS